MEKQTLINALKIVNSFYSKSKNNLKVNRDLKSINNNIEIIKQKNINDLLQFSSVDKRLEKQSVIDFILKIALSENIKINKSEYNSQFNSKNITLSVFDHFHSLASYLQKNRFKFHYQDESLIFNLNNIQYSMITFLLVENTLLLMDKKTSYFKLVKKLVDNKSCNFWRDGYYKDLLVHDRVSLSNKDNESNIIICHKNYCSTALCNSNNMKNYFTGGLFNDNNCTINPV